MRIVLVGMTPLLGEIVRETLAGEPDLEVVAEHDGDADLREALEHADADFVIVGSDAAAGGLVRALVEEGAARRALELLEDGKEGVLYELRPHQASLGELSPDALVRTIRAAPEWSNGSDTDAS